MCLKCAVFDHKLKQCLAMCLFPLQTDFVFDFAEHNFHDLLAKCMVALL